MSFHNAEPRTRQERLAAVNKEYVEKSMLKARRGNYHKYQEPGNPLVPEPTSPLYAPEASRFNKDAAAEIREQKLQAHQRKQKLYEEKRQKAVAGEQQRWQQMEEERRHEEARMQQDEVVRYRAQMRSQNLFNKSHSVSHNIITGEARHNPVPMPPAPALAR
ncbi:flagellar associated protein [Scenedesmus sp. NREL 46B-D3]|nr:flagellar associated protein [Scenedesmus sp. NREL 46B-D3]